MGSKTSFTVKDLPVSERPRERLQKYGPEALTQQEILAVVLSRGGSGKSVMTLAQELLKRFGDIDGVMRASLEQLTEIAGIGLAKAAQLKAVCYLARRLKQAEALPRMRVRVSRAQEISDLVRSEIRDPNKEYFYALMLNSRGEVIRIDEISKGSLNSTVVHPREVFKAAISACAAAVIFAHNHPSGDPEPSDDDLALTRRLVSAGDLMGIRVQDHVIVTASKHVSLRSRNLI